jgi:hypothetical protein
MTSAINHTVEPPTHRVRIDADAISAPAAYGQCCLGRARISDGAARTVAGWWATPYGVGHHLSALHAGAEVDPADLLEDIARMRRVARDNGLLPSHDARALDKLAEWVRTRHQ